jgi:hydroxymethylbilane synthase
MIMPNSSIPSKIVIATRESVLALWQANFIRDRLAELYPQTEFSISGMTTRGDQILDKSLSKIGGKGLFIKELEQALEEGRADIAVHSMKDVPMDLPPGYALAAIAEREDPRDAFVSGQYAGLDMLPVGSAVGTSSLRRESQLRAHFPHLKVQPLRGNVQTRLRKLHEGACAASLLALAGLRRLGMEDRASVVLDPDAMVPAAGQGIVGVTVRAGDHELRELLAAIEDPEARAVSNAERALLASLDGSCRTPIGGYGRLLPSGELHLTGLVARPDGSFVLKRSLHGRPEDAARIGAELGASLRRDSPRDIFA